MVVVDSFLRYLITEKRYSTHTVRSYQNDLMQFENFISETQCSDNLLSCSQRHVRSWIISLLDNRMSPRSVNRKITTLRRFFRFCQNAGVVSNNPAGDIPSLKTAKPIPVFVEESQMINLLTSDTQNLDFPGLRNLLVLELLYGTGIRVSELTGLMDLNADTKKQQIKVLGKRSKERIVPINEGLASLIGEYRKIRDQQFENMPSGHLIVTDTGKAAYSRLIYRIVNHALSDEAITGRKSPHVLRHTYATHLLNNGAELNAIKELLGHASLSATQVYTHTGFEKLKKVYEKAHPRA
jgi:integrase/recombinase XerC